MPKLPIFSGKEILRILNRIGFVQLRQRESHVSMCKETEHGRIGCVVPLHREVATGTLKGILRQAQVSEKDFIAAYKQ